MPCSESGACGAPVTPVDAGARVSILQSFRSQIADRGSVVPIPLPGVFLKEANADDAQTPAPSLETRNSSTD